MVNWILVGVGALILFLLGYDLLNRDQQQDEIDLNDPDKVEPEIDEPFQTTI